MPEYVVRRVAGAVEGKKMRIVQVTGTIVPQEWDGLSSLLLKKE